MIILTYELIGNTWFLNFRLNYSETSSPNFFSKTLLKIKAQRLNLFIELKKKKFQKI